MSDGSYGPPTSDGEDPESTKTNVADSLKTIHLV
jgi:hypothetical protein